MQRLPPDNPAIAGPQRAVAGLGALAAGAGSQTPLRHRVCRCNPSHPPRRRPSMHRRCSSHARLHGGPACNGRCGTLYPSTSRKLYLWTAGHRCICGPEPEESYPERGGALDSSVLAVGRVSSRWTSAHRVLRSPSGPASDVTLATNAAAKHASQRARRERCCASEGMSSAMQRWSSVGFSPRKTWTNRLHRASRWQRPPRRRGACHAGVSIQEESPTTPR